MLGKIEGARESERTRERERWRLIATARIPPRAEIIVGRSCETRYSGAVNRANKEEIVVSSGVLTSESRNDNVVASDFHVIMPPPGERAPMDEPLRSCLRQFPSRYARSSSRSVRIYPISVLLAKLRETCKSFEKRAPSDLTCSRFFLPAIDALWMVENED